MLKLHTYPQRYRIELFAILTTRFNLQELQTLCFAIPVNFDLLEGGELGSKARELVLFMMRNGRLGDLVETGRILRPEIPWPNIPSSNIQREDWTRIEKEFTSRVEAPVQVDIAANLGPSRVFLLAKAIATTALFAILFQLWGGPIIERISCTPESPVPCLRFDANWWIIGGILGLLTGLGLIPSSREK